MRIASIAVMLLLVLTLLGVLVVPANSAGVAVYSRYATLGSAFVDRVASLGYDCLLLSQPMLTASEEVDVLYVTTGSAFLLASQSAEILDFVRAGGGLIIEQPNVVGPVPILPPELSISVSSIQTFDPRVCLTECGLSHEITAGLSPGDLSGNMDTVFMADVSPGYQVLAVSASDQRLVALAVAVYGKGRIVFLTGNLHPWSVMPGSNEFLRRLIDWAAGPRELTVAIDIKPGDAVNSINPRSKGVVPVAVLSTPEFDALAVDPSTVLFAQSSPIRWSYEDVDSDGDLDVLFHFRTQDLVLSVDSSEAELTGSTCDGQPIRGTDAIRIVPSARRS